MRGWLKRFFRKVLRDLVTAGLAAASDVAHSEVDQLQNTTDHERLVAHQVVDLTIARTRKEIEDRL